MLGHSNGKSQQSNIVRLQQSTCNFVNHQGADWSQEILRTQNFYELQEQAVAKQSAKYDIRHRQEPHSLLPSVVWNMCRSVHKDAQNFLHVPDQLISV